MRAIKSLKDAEIAIRSLQDSLDSFPNGNLDLKGNRIINAGKGLNATDLITVDQLPSLVDQPQQSVPIFYTAIFSNSGLVNTGDSIPDFEVGWGREGQPIEVWVDAQGAPIAGLGLSINIKLITYKPDGSAAVIRNLLKDNLVLSSTDYIPLLNYDGSSTGNNECIRKYSRTLLSPVPKIPRGSKLRPVIVNGGNASVVSIGVVIQCFNS